VLVRLWPGIHRQRNANSYPGLQQVLPTETAALTSPLVDGGRLLVSPTLRQPLAATALTGGNRPTALSLIDVGTGGGFQH